MKFNRRFLTFFTLLFTCALLVTLSIVPIKAQITRVPPPELTSKITVNGFSPYPEEIAFGDLAWRTFVALNWPASCEDKTFGKPLKNIIGTNTDKPRVWEFYQFPRNIFLFNNEEDPPSPSQCVGEQELKPITPVRLDEINEDPNIKITDQGQVLIDQSGNYILKETRMNPIEVKEVVDNQWYSADNIADDNFDEDNRFALVCNDEKQNTNNNRFPCYENNQEGAIEIKMAWTIIPDPTEDKEKFDYYKSKYYTTTRTFFANKVKTQNGFNIEQITVPVALIGFHIVHKTSNRGWIWSTFDHVDNAPTEEQTKNTSPEQTYNLYNSNCQDNCDENTPYGQKPFLWSDKPPYAVTVDKDTNKIKPQIRSQITRLTPVTPNAELLNTAWHKALNKIAENKGISGGSIWQYYQLIGTQWLSNPKIPNPEYYKNLTKRKGKNDTLRRNIQPRQGSEPSRLANVAIEPYADKLTKGDSCIECHALASLPKSQNTSFPFGVSSDFSFLFNDAGQ